MFRTNDDNLSFILVISVAKSKLGPFKFIVKVIST
jgi:hypothetical protein